MSNQQFTPGPWKVDLYRRYVYVVAGDDFVICERGEEAEETLANAHLIAAAPDMYEALQYALRELEAHINGAPVEAKYLGSNDTPTTRRIVAALHKATGKIG